MELNINQKRVMRPDGRLSVISAKLAANHAYMSKHQLVIVENNATVTPVAVNIPVNAPKEKPVANEELMKQLGQLGLNASDIGLKAPEATQTEEEPMTLIEDETIPEPEPQVEQPKTGVKKLNQKTNK